MNIRKKDKFFTIGTVVVAVIVLVCVCLFTVKLGWIAYPVSAVAVILTITAILSCVRRVISHLHEDAELIENFFNSASEGCLDQRLHVDDENAFRSITYDLNIMMDNLERMSRSKSEFLSSMSHEIRTPMNAIIGMSQLANSSDDPAQIMRYMHKIEDNSTHLLGVINDILDYSKIESGKMELDKHLFSLRQNMDFIESMFQSRAEQKNLKLTIRVCDINHDGLIADALRLNQVLINLLSNAVKFTDSGGRIDLTVAEAFHVNGESVYTFSVEDTGIGIEPAQAARLFTPFVQANAGMARKYGGTGLGLVISKNLVELMGGEIELDSRPGIGSTFSFTIRVHAQEAVAPAELAEASRTKIPDLTGDRLLIVDDIEINREIAVEMLRDSGAEMETADSGQVSLDMYLASPIGYYDLILMDMQMPGMDGCEATERIRASGRADAATIRIVAMTANVMQEDLKRAYDSGMDDHIGKPIDFTKAYALISKVLQKQDEERES